MTIQEAIQNVDNVIASVNLNRQQHFTLVESMKLIMARCKLADQLEKEKTDGESKSDV